MELELIRQLFSYKHKIISKVILIIWKVYLQHTCTHTWHEKNVFFFPEKKKERKSNLRESATCWIEESMIHNNTKKYIMLREEELSAGERIYSNFPLTQNTFWLKASYEEVMLNFYHFRPYPIWVIGHRHQLDIIIIRLIPIQINVIRCHGIR